MPNAPSRLTNHSSWWRESLTRLYPNRGSVRSRASRAASLLPPLGCGGDAEEIDGDGQIAQEPLAITVKVPLVLCSDHTDEAIATFEDTNLEEAIRAALSVGAQEDLTCGLVSGLTNLTAQNAGIESLVGIQNLTGLTDIRFSGNSITDISVLSGLTSLTSRLIGRTSSC